MAPIAPIESMQPVSLLATLSVSLQSRVLPLWHLLGPGSPGAVQSAGLPLPEIMQARSLTDGFIARTGQEEFLIAATTPPTADGLCCWCYGRDDRVLALTGPDWRRVMAQVCHADLRGFVPDDWQLLAAAGVNLWCLGIDEGLLLGCDPSLGHYLQQTLTEVVHDLTAASGRSGAQPTSQRPAPTPAPAPAPAPEPEPASTSASASPSRIGDQP